MNLEVKSEQPGDKPALGFETIFAAQQPLQPETPSASNLSNLAGACVGCDQGCDVGCDQGCDVGCDAGPCYGG